MFEEEIQVVEQQEVNSLMGLVDEQISQIEWPRCTKCKRHMYGHDPRRGQGCKMSILTNDELKDHDKLIMEMRLKKKKELEEQV